MFDIFSFWKRVFGGTRQESRTCAKDRLRLVLVSDRAMISPQVLEHMRQEIVDVISKYMDIDTCSMQIGLERQEGALALAANIPVRAVRRSSQEYRAVSISAKEQAQQPVAPEPIISLPDPKPDPEPDPEPDPKPEQVSPALQATEKPSGAKSTDTKVTPGSSSKKSRRRKKKTAKSSSLPD